MRFPRAMAALLVVAMMTVPAVNLGAEAASRSPKAVLQVSKQWTSPEFESWATVQSNDTDRDGAQELLVWSEWNGTLAVYDPPDYRVVYNLTYDYLRLVQLVDVGMNGSRQLLVTGVPDRNTYDEKMTLIDGDSFTEKASISTPNSFGEPVVADVDGNGKCEIVILNESIVILEGATLQVKWMSPVLENPGNTMRAMQLDSDSAQEILVQAFNTTGNTSELMTYDGASHALQWNISIPANNSMVTLGEASDLDADGSRELFVENVQMNESWVTLATQYYLLSGSTGAEEWNFSVNSSAQYRFQDLDADKSLECLVTASDSDGVSMENNLTFTVFNLKQKKMAWSVGPLRNSFSMTQMTTSDITTEDINVNGIVDLLILNSTIDMMTGNTDYTFTAFDGKTFVQVWKSPVFKGQMAGIQGQNDFWPLRPVEIDSDGTPELILSEFWMQPPNRVHGIVHIYSTTDFSEEWNTGDLQSVAFGMGGQFIKDQAVELLVLQATETQSWFSFIDPSTHKITWSSAKYSFANMGAINFPDLVGASWNEALITGIDDDGNGFYNSTLIMLNDTTLNESWRSERMEGEASIYSISDVDSDGHREAVLMVNRTTDEWDMYTRLVIYDFWEGRLPMPDLALSPPDLKVSSGAPFVGMPVNITVRLRNIGDLNATGCFVGLFVDGTAVENQTADVDILGITQLVFNWTATAGTHVLTVKADPSNLLEELEEGNNNASVNITVGPRPAPTALIASPRDGELFEEGTRVNFSANGSAAPAGGVLGYEWSSELQGPLNNAQNFSMMLLPGLHTITLVVGDGFGQSVASVNITVTPRPPPPGTTTAVISSPRNGAIFKSGDQISFDGTKSLAAVANYTLSYRWSSNQSGQLGTSNRFSKALPAGNHNISLTIDDSHGGRSVAHVNIRVLASERVIALIATPQEGEMFDPDTDMAFDGSGSAGPAGAVLTYSWDDNASGQIGTDKRFDKALEPGAHVVTLTVSDGKGHTGTAVVNFTVKPRPNKAPRVEIISPLDGAQVKDTVEISGTAWDDTRLEAIFLRIDGLGTESIAVGTNWSHSWDTKKVKNGPHRITVWASDGKLLSPEITINVTVKNSAPTKPGSTMDGGTTLLIAGIGAGVLAIAVVGVVLTRRRGGGGQAVEVSEYEEVETVESGKQPESVPAPKSASDPKPPIMY